MLRAAPVPGPGCTLKQPCPAFPAAAALWECDRSRSPRASGPITRAAAGRTTMATPLFATCLGWRISAACHLSWPPLLLQPDGPAWVAQTAPPWPTPHPAIAARALADAPPTENARLNRKNGRAVPPFLCSAGPAIFLPGPALSLLAELHRGALHKPLRREPVMLCGPAFRLE